MELPSFDPPTLAAHQLETHEVKHTPPSDRPQLQGIWVERRADGVRDGREVWRFATGEPFQAGARRDGLRVGTWQTFDLGGLGYKTETARADGCFDVQRFVRADLTAAWILAATGVAEPAADGALRDHGWWTYDPTGDHPYQVEFRHGHAVRSRPMLDLLREALDRGDVPRAFELASYGGDTLYFGIEDLARDGYVLAPTLLPWLVERTLPAQLSFLLPHLRAQAATLRPVFEVHADELVAANFENPTGGSATWQVTRLAIILADLDRAQTGAPLDPRWDPLLAEALVANERQIHAQEPVELLTEVVRQLPMARREALVLQEHARRRWVHGDVLWTYAAAAAPSARVLDRALAAIAAMARDEFSDTLVLDYDRVRERTVRHTLSAFGSEAVPAFERWLAGDGQDAPQRALVIEAIANARVPASAATLLAFAGDASDPARAAARHGLAKLGALALPALQAAAAGKDRKLRATAEAMHERLAQAAAPGRTVPASTQALAALRASIGSETWARFEAIARMRHGEFHATYGEALAADAPRTFVIVHDLAMQDHTDVVWQRMDFDQNTNAVRYHLEKHAGLAALVAERLYRVPHTPAYRALVEDSLAERTVDVLEPLGYLCEGALPLAADYVAAHVARHWPWAGRRVLLACATSERKVVRTAAVAGLIDCGAPIVPEVLPLLARKDDGPLAAAEVLAALAEPGAIAPLQATLATETRKVHRDAMKKAVTACRAAQRRSAAGG